MPQTIVGAKQGHLEVHTQGTWMVADTKKCCCLSRSSLPSYVLSSGYKTLLSVSALCLARMACIVQEGQCQTADRGHERRTIACGSATLTHQAARILQPSLLRGACIPGVDVA